MAAAIQQRTNTYFETSCQDYANYPTNLVYRASYRKVLESYKHRLDEASDDLFLEEGTADKLDVRMLDFNEAAKRFDEVPNNHLNDLTSLRVFLGDSSSATISRFVKHDPKCRYVLMYSDMNRSPLRISRAMASYLLSFHQVMPSYLDFMSVFGLQLDQRELRFSGFHEQTTLLASPAKRPGVPELSRSGHGYQLCYNLKAVVNKGSKDQPDWSIRQAALHHQFDFGKGTALWICTEGRRDGGLFDRIRDLTCDSKRPEDWSYDTKREAFVSSLATHLTSCHWSVEDWRTYTGWLEETFETETQHAIKGIHTAIQGVTLRTYKSKDLQLVQSFEDKVNDLIMILEANNDNMKSLSSFYVNLMQNDGLDTVFKQSCTEDVHEFAAQIADMIYDASMQIRRGKLLVKLTADRKALILQHLQGQATKATLDLTYMSYKEAIIMRIITVVTIIFLPATFVSTFFSTDIVKYQDQDGNGSFSSLAMYRWLQVTLPLSAITLGIGFAWYKYQTKKSSRKGLLPGHYA